MINEKRQDRLKWLSFFSLLLGAIYLLNIFPTITGNIILFQSDISLKDSLLLGQLFLLQGIILRVISRRQERKGQAAMEFLLTYGWVILAGLIALGVFIYIVGFSRSAIPSNEFTLDPPWYGNGYRFDLDNYPTSGPDFVELEIKNIGPAEYTINRLEVEGCTMDSASRTIKPSFNEVITLYCNEDVPLDFGANVNLWYYQGVNMGEDPIIQQSSVGRVGDPRVATSCVTELVDFIETRVCNICLGSGCVQTSYEYFEPN